FFFLALSATSRHPVSCSLHAIQCSLGFPLTSKKTSHHVGDSTELACHDNYLSFLQFSSYSAPSTE
ncbi:hypothetical protein TRIATDRAFT_298814, partial [Trichoderma atroviride IMI 206040]